jgi:hypothetical protein
MVNRAIGYALIAGALCVGLAAGAPYAGLLARWGLARARVHLRLAWRAVASLAVANRIDQRAQQVIRLERPTKPPSAVFINGHIDPFTLDALRGQGVLVLFGARDCRGDCLRALALLTRVKQALGVYAQQVRFVVIGVDAEPAAGPSLLRLVKAHDPDFMVLTAEPGTVVPFARHHGMTIIQPHGVPSRMVMPLVPYLVYLNPQGYWTMCFPLGMSAEEIADEIIYSL